MGRVIQRPLRASSDMLGVIFTFKIHFDVVCVGHWFVVTTDCILPMFASWLIILFKHPMNALHSFQTQLTLIAPYVYRVILYNPRS